MANEEQLSILKQGVEVWNEWRLGKLIAPDLIGAVLIGANLMAANLNIAKLSEAYLRGANLRDADLSAADLREANLWRADLTRANLSRANLTEADLSEADLRGANLRDADLSVSKLIRAYLSAADLKAANLKSADLTEANLSATDLWKADLFGADLKAANLFAADLREADLRETKLLRANLTGTNLTKSNFSKARLGNTIFGDADLGEIIGLDDVVHLGPSSISTDIFVRSKGKIPEVFLKGCGLSDWEIEQAKLYNPDLSNEEINNIQYRMYDLRATQALQISPLFISYSHEDGVFVDRIEIQLNKKGIRFWRDTHEMKAGRIETQIDRAISQNPTVLLVLSENSLSSDWVEHEVRTARGLEKEMGRDVLCPVALDDSWKSSRWPKRIMEQIMEYNILDFSEWQDDSKFDGMFRKLIDGLELFYKG